MNKKQESIKKDWKELSKDEKKELLVELYQDSVIQISLEDALTESTMNFGSLVPCPTCGK
ncbi:hypothetical protein [Proteus mirabilis]|uniref:hypothetical protein n=1 Tax=Proteus mirabilis TaxID=584 RepID=UPI00217E3E0B|nr:hypothetical protein [Proteus mirabilis]MCS6724287.1 hypothetical protein [Proteus mirabilis]MDF7232182.1 hypothetical protein [Proteus mirabilis]